MNQTENGFHSNEAALTYWIKRLSASFRFRIVYHYRKKNQRKLIRKDFTIISNNCWGGVISEKYGLRKNSPTVGLLINGDDYIKFCGNLKYYLSQKLVFFPLEQSKYAADFHDMSFPAAKLDDIEVYFMHYADEQTAAEKWYRRCERVNWDFLIYKISEREAFSEQDMEHVAALPLEQRIIIGEKKYTPDTVVIPGIHTCSGSEEDIVADIFDEAEYLNSIAKGL